MYRNKTASQHNFAIIPNTEVPRSKFNMRQTRKMAFNASELIPIMCEEVLPGDTWQHEEHIMARFATPYAPAVDDIDLETFYFWVPNRIAGKWSLNDDYTQQDWEDFITGVNTTTPPPTVAPPNVGAPPWTVDENTLADHFGIPPAAYTAQLELNAFPFWAYFNIYNEWFRDQNLQDPWRYTVGDWDQFTNGTDSWDGFCLRINKRHDYFTSSLPFPQKGADVTLPLGTTATVFTASAPLITTPQPAIRFANTASGSPTGPGYLTTSTISGFGTTDLDGGLAADNTVFPSNLFADLQNATAATINEIRRAVTTQQMLEKDARGGSRYVESLLVHFGVRLADYRANRPEYLGGSKIPINVNPVAQSATYDIPGSGGLVSPVGNLGAEMHAQGSKRTFEFAATEHGFIIGLCAVRSTPTYQQGIRRHWLNRNTRLDYYFPTMANLGEQAVNTVEIFVPLDTVPTNLTWGYQERNAEMRYTPNEITGVLRSSAALPMDWWHYAENLTAEPVLNEDFITDKTQETLARSLATAPSAQWSAQVILDILHDSQVARLMPAYSVPGITKF